MKSGNIEDRIEDRNAKYASGAKEERLDIAKITTVGWRLDT